MSAELMTINMAMQTVENYLCSHCWGRLIASRDPETALFRVHCANDCGGEGFVTKSGVERREEEAGCLAAEARINLRNIIRSPQKSNEQILKELDY